MIGKELARRQVAHKVAVDADLLQVAGLRSRHFAAPLDFVVKKQEILGITGLIGAGKTELAHAIFGVDPVQAGSITLDGRPVRIDSPRKAVALGIGYLPEDRDADGLCLNLGVKDNVSLVQLAKRTGLLVNVAEEKRTVTGLIDAIGIKTAGLAQQVKFLSGGNKQKVVFGKWLTARCNLLILDEPTIGIDVGARGEIYELIRQFVASADRAVIFISSDVTEVLEVADRILVMAGGVLAAELDPKQTSKQEIMQYSLRAVTV